MSNSGNNNNSVSDDDIQLSSKKMKKNRLVLDSDDDIEDNEQQKLDDIEKKVKKDEIIIKTNEQVEEKKIKLNEKSNIIQKQKQQQQENDQNKKKLEQQQQQQKSKSQKKIDIYSDSMESEDDIKIKKVKKSDSKQIQKQKTTPQKKVEKQIDKKKKIEKPSNQKNKQPSDQKPINLLVSDVLKRWWYCLPSWPPENYDYSESLMNNKLKLVDINDWKFQPDMDSNQFQKVYQISGYPGCFKNSKGEFFDLRPRDSCPCFDNLSKKSTKELTQLLAKALNNQIKDFEKSGINDPKFLNELKNQLVKVQKLVDNFKNK